MWKNQTGKKAPNRCALLFGLYGGPLYWMWAQGVQLWKLCFCGLLLLFLVLVSWLDGLVWVMDNNPIGSQPLCQCSTTDLCPEFNYVNGCAWDLSWGTEGLEAAPCHLVSTLFLMPPQVRDSSCIQQPHRGWGISLSSWDLWVEVVFPLFVFNSLVRARKPAQTLKFYHRSQGTC